MKFFARRYEAVQSYAVNGSDLKIPLIILAVIHNFPLIRRKPLKGNKKQFFAPSRIVYMLREKSFTIWM